MKDRKTLRYIIAGCCLITFLALTPSFVVDARQSGAIRWAVRLDPVNPDYIEVYLDATELPTNMIAEKVNFTVAFHIEQHSLIEKKSFNFLDKDLLAIKPLKYRRYFLHSLQNVNLVEGIDLSVYGKGGGSKADTPPLFHTKPDNWSEYPNLNDITVVGSTPPKPPKEGASGELTLLKTSFSLPGDGAPNNGGYIGPFCCTGETVTVYSNDGKPLGYIYFGGWKGQALQVGNKAFAPEIEVLVSGLTNLSDVNSGQQQSSVSFEAQDMVPGTSRSTKAGNLLFAVIIEKVKREPFNGKMYFEMGSVVVKATASISQPKPLPDTRKQPHRSSHRTPVWKGI